MATSKLSGGHSSTVLCVDVQLQTGQVVSGGEDNQLCLWTAEGQVAGTVTRPEADCTSVVCSKENPNLVYAAFGQEILVLDIARLQEPVFVFQSNTDEVNQIVLDAKDQFLAACDDSGEIKVYSLQDRKVFKTLRYKHTNICSTAVFRPGRHWEIISGGLDCRLVHWDFSKLKCLNQFNMQELHATPGDTPYMINPPFVHHIAASPSGSSFALALENGQIPILSGAHKNPQPKHALFGHSQGVSQVHFLSDDLLISAGNDACINEWDVSKAALYNPGHVVMNGDSHHHSSSPEEEKNAAITELCRTRTFSHTSKVNWIAPHCTPDTKRLFVADQTTDVSVLDWS